MTPESATGAIAVESRTSAPAPPVLARRRPPAPELTPEEFDRALAHRPHPGRDAAAMLQRVARGMWDSLRHNWRRTLILMVIGGGVAYLGNLALLAAISHASGVVPAGSPTTARGSEVSGSIFWALALAIVCTLVSYRLSVGGKQFWRGVRNLPATPVRLFTTDGRASLGHTLWGFAGAMLVAVLVSPAVSAMLALGVALVVVGLLRSVVTGLVTELWRRLFGKVSQRAARGPGDSGVSVGMLGAVAGLLVAIFAHAVLVKLVIALIAAVAALLLSRLTAKPGGRVMTPASLALTIVSVVILALVNVVVAVADGPQSMPSGAYTMVITNADINGRYIGVFAFQDNGGSISGNASFTVPSSCGCPSGTWSGSTDGVTIHMVRDVGGAVQTYQGSVTGYGLATGTWGGSNALGNDTWTMSLNGSPYTASLLGGVFGLGGSLFGAGLGRPLSLEEQREIALRRAMQRWRQQHPCAPWSEFWANNGGDPNAWNDFWQGPRLVGAQQGFYKAANDQAQGIIDIKALFDHFAFWLSHTTEGQQFMDDPLHSEQSRNLSQWLIDFPRQGAPQAVLDQVNALQYQLDAMQAAQQRGDSDTAENLKGQLLGNGLFQLYVAGIQGLLGPEGEVAQADMAGLRGVPEPPLMPPEELPLTPTQQWMREQGIQQIGPVLDANGNPVISRNQVIQIVYDDGSGQAFKPVSGEVPLPDPELGATSKMNREVGNSIVAQALGNDQVPQVVILDHPELGPGSAMTWVPYTQPESKSTGVFSRVAQQMAAVQDYITGNIDRHFGNIGVGQNGQLVTPDGGETFPMSAPRRAVVSVFVAEQVNEPLEGSVLKAVQSIDPQQLATNLTNAGLAPEQVSGAVARLNEISQNGMITGQTWTAQGGSMYNGKFAGIKGFTPNGVIK